MEALTLKSSKFWTFQFQKIMKRYTSIQRSNEYVCQILWWNILNCKLQFFYELWGWTIHMLKSDFLCSSHFKVFHHDNLHICTLSLVMCVFSNFKVWVLILQKLKPLCGPRPSFCIFARIAERPSIAKPAFAAHRNWRLQATTERANKRGEKPSRRHGNNVAGAERTTLAAGGGGAGTSIALPRDARSSRCAATRPTVAWAVPRWPLEATRWSFAGSATSRPSPRLTPSSLFSRSLNFWCLIDCWTDRCVSVLRSRALERRGCDGEEYIETQCYDGINTSSISSITR